jgi:hypothetical protein
MESLTGRWLRRVVDFYRKVLTILSMAAVNPDQRTRSLRCLTGTSVWSSLKVQNAAWNLLLRP